MKKSKISITLAAAAAILCLCGVFFCPQVNISAPTAADTSASQTDTEFSLSSAKEYLELCSVSYYPETLEAKLKELKYTDYEYYRRDQDSSYGSGIAFGIALLREGADITVTAVLRGTNKGEWYSNFSIGDGTEHAGFSAATDYAEKKLDEYLKGLDLTKSSVKMVITGHSRGGAVANILAKRLLTEGEYKSVTAYTFASPNTTTAADAKHTRYQSIYNIMNPEDFICYIPLEKWGYTKYGIDMELPKSGSENYDELYADMQDSFQTITGYEHTGYPFGDKDVKIFINTAADIAPTVDDYYNKEVTVSPHRVTLYEYMLKVAALLNGDDTLANGMFLVSSGSSYLFNTLTEFMMEGISIEDVAKDMDITTSAIHSGHTYETYEAWLNVLDEEYFLSSAQAKE